MANITRKIIRANKVSSTKLIIAGGHRPKFHQLQVRFDKRAINLVFSSNGDIEITSFDPDCHLILGCSKNQKVSLAPDFDTNNLKGVQ